MESSVLAVETLFNHKFENPKLLEEALTHSSYSDAPSYERLEFIGDSVLGLAISNHLFLAHPQLDQGPLTDLRSANVSTEKLARVAVRHDLYRYLRRNADVLDDKVREFSRAVLAEGSPVAHGGLVKAPKVLADIVESVAGAIYFDVNCDLTRFWVIFRGFLEPIVGPGDLEQQPQPVRLLHELCQKWGKKVEIQPRRNGSTYNANVSVDGQFIASGASENLQIARLNASREALATLSQSESFKDLMMELGGINASFKIEEAKNKLHELCRKKKWPKPIFCIEKESGPAHQKRFICSVQIATVDGVLCIHGEEMPRVKEAENSASFLMCLALLESNYL